MTLTVESWCEALESGKYKQAMGQLRDSGCFCCLGVLCDLSGRGEWLEDDAFYIEHYEANHTLPLPLKMDIGLCTDIGEFDFKSLPGDLRAAVTEATGRAYGPVALTDLNDNGCPFSIIAKVIRARPEGLFREDAQP